MSSKNNNSGNSNRRPGRRRRGKKKSVQPTEFWGSPEALADQARTVRLTTQPSAVVKSLGRPPLSGHQNVAEHYFTAVYDRAVGLGGALAAAGGLLAEDDQPDPS